MAFEQIGKYKILGEIGRGAMGEVFKAHDPILNRYVAIKTISASLGADDELRKRFHREAQAAARLNHPNIITVFDFGEEHGKIYMAMELLEGTDLKDVIAAGGLPTITEKLGVMEQVCDGMAFAHEKEVVHRDLKPGNIHIQPNGQIKIMDFGLARLGSSEMTQAGMVMGTPNYMSPEQVMGERADVRSDVFSVGAVFYEILTSHKPFDADSIHAVLFQVMHKEPPPLRQWAPDTPVILAEVVERCLSKDRNQRFQNAGEVREALGYARQALASGRAYDATLESEVGQATMEPQPASRPRSWPPAPADQQWVEGTVALDPTQAGLEEVLEETPATLSGRTPTQRASMPRGRARVPGPAPPPPSRAPIYIGIGAVVAIAVGVGIYLKTRGPDPVLEMLIATRLQLAQRALDDKDYAGAIDQAKQTLAIAPEHAAVKQFLEKAQAKQNEIDTTAKGAKAAFDGGDSEKASELLKKLYVLDPKHPVAQDLSEKLNSFFSAQADEARDFTTKSRADAEKAKADTKADSTKVFSQAMTLQKEAEAFFLKKSFAEATRAYFEARDKFDAAKRATEPKPTPPPIGQTPAPPPTTLPTPTTTLPTPTTTFPTPTTTLPPPTTTLPPTPTTVPLGPAIGRLAPAPTNCVRKDDKGGEAPNPDFTGNVEWEAPAAVRTGDPYTVKAFLSNSGQKAMKIRELSVRLRVNRQGTPQTVAPKTPSIEVGQRGLLWEGTGTFEEGLQTWVLSVDLYGDNKKDQCSSGLSLKKQ